MVKHALCHLSCPNVDPRKQNQHEQPNPNDTSSLPKLLSSNVNIQQQREMDTISKQHSPSTILTEEKQDNSRVKKPHSDRGQETITILSANANSLKNKITSLKFDIAQLHPHIIAIQETKIKRKSQIGLKGYEIYPTFRGDNGGGVMIACLSSLDPVLIFEGEAECEVLVVQVTLKSKPLRIIAGYGPQECAPRTVRETYRNTIEEQVECAYLAGCMVLIAEDANAKLGQELIENDPHTMSENGRLLADMINRQNLFLINSSD